MVGQVLEIGRSSAAVAATLNEFLNESEGWLNRRGLTLEYHTDISGWVRHMRTAVHADGINPTFDPAHSPVSAQNSYWLDIRDRGGSTVACIAVRMIYTADFSRHISSMRLWFDPPPLGMEQSLDLVLPAETPIISGRVAHYGGHWVHPSWRGREIPGLLLPLAKILTLDLFRSDWDTGIVFSKNAVRKSLVNAYGFANTVLCYSGSFPPAHRDDTLFLTYSSRAQTLSLMPHAIMKLRPRIPADDPPADRYAEIT